jgi:hypothetical protein
MQPWPAVVDVPAGPASGAVAAEARDWANRVDNADGFIFITPEYNHGYPAPLKNAIDHLYREWGHKPAAIVSYGGLAGGYRAAEQLRQVLVELKWCRCASRWASRPSGPPSTRRASRETPVSMALSTRWPRNCSGGPRRSSRRASAIGRYR